jgi:hypothetical protein
MHHLPDEQPPNVYEYTGDGKAYHSGIPMRHLTQADVDNLAPEHREALGRSPVYLKVGARGGKGKENPLPEVDEQGHSLVPADESVVRGQAADEVPNADPSQPGVEPPAQPAQPAQPAPDEPGEPPTPPASQNKTGAGRTRSK